MTPLSTWDSDSILLIKSSLFIFLWVGALVPESSRREPLEYAYSFMSSHGMEEDGRPIVKIPGGREPSFFITFVAKMNELSVSNNTPPPPAETPPPSSAPASPVPSKLFTPSNFYAYEQLAKGRMGAVEGGKEVPEDVDLARKEMYLDDDTFMALFNMDKSQFVALPKWRQVAKKKELGLF